jgi:hypothetical protein
MQRQKSTNRRIEPNIKSIRRLQHLSNRRG